MPLGRHITPHARALAIVVALSFLAAIEADQTKPKPEQAIKAEPVPATVWKAASHKAIPATGAQRVAVRNRRPACLILMTAKATPGTIASGTAFHFAAIARPNQG